MLQSLWECNRRDERAEVLFPIFPVFLCGRCDSRKWKIEIRNWKTRKTEDKFLMVEDLDGSALMGRASYSTIADYSTTMR